MDESLVLRRETHVAAPGRCRFRLPDRSGEDHPLDGHGGHYRGANPGGLYLINGVSGRKRARRLPGGRAGPPARLQLRLGGRRGRSAGIEPDRDRFGRAEWRHASAHDPYRAAERREARRPRARLGALLRQTCCRRRRGRSGTGSWAPSITGRRNAARTGGVSDLPEASTIRLTCASGSWASCCGSCWP